MFYNHFNKFITGLGFNRSVFKGETPPAEPVENKAEKKSDQDYDREAVRQAYAETQEAGQRLAEKARKAGGEAPKEKYTRPDYNKKTVQMRTVSGYVDTGMPHEEALKGKPKLTDAEIAEREGAKILAQDKAEQELASLLGEKPEERAFMTDQEKLASYGVSAEAEIAALLGEKKEFPYIKDSLASADTRGLQTWMALVNRAAEALSGAAKGSDIDKIINELVEKQDSADFKNGVRSLGEVAKFVKAKPGEPKRNIAQKMLNHLTRYDIPEEKKRILTQQFDLLYG